MITSMVKEKIREDKKRMDEKDALELRRRISNHAQKVVAERFRESSRPDHSSRYPKFSLQDVVQGQYLGKGKFGTVFEVLGLDGRGRLSSANNNKCNISGSFRRDSMNHKWFQRPTNGIQPTIKGTGMYESEDDDDMYDLESDDGNEDDHQDEETSLQEDTFLDSQGGSRVSDAMLQRKQDDAKVFMRQHCLRETDGRPRYAIKILRAEVLHEPTTLYFQGIMDMASETRLLSSIRHPHIIKLRGVGCEPCSESYFLILDRLYQTLEQRWKQWQKLNRRYSCFWGLIDRRARRRASLYQERIVYAHDLASGLAYLHSKKILHRDIKSDNIGFDVRGDIKIFDFGLARELPPQARATADGTWKMTGNTGTPRYMSPEVALEHTYNESCDTYSFCILLWEILSLDTAFELYTWASFRERVWNGPHKRPFLHPNVWSKEIQAMLKQGWHADLKQRQPMTEIVETLRQEVIRRGGFDDEWGLVLERQSTHIFDESDIHYLHNSHESLLAMIASPLRRTVRFSGMVGSLTSKTPSKVDTTTSTHMMDGSGRSVPNSPQLVTSTPPLPFEPPRMHLDDADDDEGSCSSSSHLSYSAASRTSRGEQDLLGREQSVVASPNSAAIYRQVIAETVRRKRERILGSNDEEDRLVIESEEGICDERDGNEIMKKSTNNSNDRDNVVIAASRYSNFRSTPSAIYEEVKAETVRRERHRLFGLTSNHVDGTADVVRGRQLSSSSLMEATDIWARIREENVRQSELRSRLSMNRDVPQHHTAQSPIPQGQEEIGQ